MKCMPYPEIMAFLDGKLGKGPISIMKSFPEIFPFNQNNFPAQYSELRTLSFFI